MKSALIINLKKKLKSVSKAPTVIFKMYDNALTKRPLITRMGTYFVSFIISGTASQYLKHSKNITSVLNNRIRYFGMILCNFSLMQIFLFLIFYQIGNTTSNQAFRPDLVKTLKFA